MNILSFIQKTSMDFYADARSRNPNTAVRIHPLLLSLSETFNASPANPNISTTSENDERLSSESPFYTERSALPSLEIHFSGQNGPHVLPNQNRYSLTESYADSRLPRMHAAFPSRQLGGRGKCHSSEFSGNISCLERQFSKYRQRISASEPAQQREEASTCFFGGRSGKSSKHSRSEGGWGNSQIQEGGEEGRFLGC
jgi:hypothetical protein